MGSNKPRKGQSKVSRTKYPWDKWLKKDQFLLNRGRDYHVPQSTFASEIRVAAWYRGIKVSLTDYNRAFLVTVISRGSPRSKKGRKEESQGQQDQEIRMLHQEPPRRVLPSIGSDPLLAVEGIGPSKDSLT